MRRPRFLSVFAGCSLLSRAIDKLVEELKPEQSDEEDLVHFVLPSVEEKSLDPMKPRLRAVIRQVPMLQLLSEIDEKVISGLLMPSLMLEDAKRTLIDSTATSLEACPLGDVHDVAASDQSFRSLLALASGDLDDITNELRSRFK